MVSGDQISLRAFETGSHGRHPASASVATSELSFQRQRQAPSSTVWLQWRRDRFQQDRGGRVHALAVIAKTASAILAFQVPGPQPELKQQSQGTTRARHFVDSRRYLFSRHLVMRPAKGESD